MLPLVLGCGEGRPLQDYGSVAPALEGMSGVHLGMSAQAEGHKHAG